jgi:hypothetical protein
VGNLTHISVPVNGKYWAITKLEQISWGPWTKRAVASDDDSAHNHPVNRALHMIAIPVGFSSLIVVWFHWMIGLH